ncbi:uncharacterized protein LOC142350513 [Convolutriloba macropyga]|uniref:uncharacterized protein LOC142350513 n=1 Tax=Convolutriloba macropyga TaxID=536237 RepID=UPI003F52411D
MRKRIEPVYASLSRKNQEGFKWGVGCRDQIFSHRQILEQRNQFHRLTSVAFVDFKAAFDRVNRECLWKIAASLGLPNKVICVLRAMYTESRSQATLYNATSRYFRQGSILAPFLFNLVIDHIMISALRSGKFGASLDDTAMADLDYADDIALVDDNIYDIQRLLDALNIEAESCCLKINLKKTEICSNQEDATLSCKGVQLNLVEHLTNLESSIQLNGDIAREMKSRIGRAPQSYKHLDKFWCMKNIPRSLRSNSTTPVSPICFSTPAKLGSSEPQSSKVGDVDSTRGAGEELLETPQLPATSTSPSNVDA